MLRVSKLTDYATVVMTVLAEAQLAGPAVLSAQELAERARLEVPTVSKLLKRLAQAGLVESFRGTNGGYRLARARERINLADIVVAMEGPFGMTECSAQVGSCGHEPHCGVRGNWRRVSDVIETSLQQMSLADMCRPTPKRAQIPVRVAIA
jgi:FeS assembly SUF system regulator